MRRTFCTLVLLAAVLFNGGCTGESSLPLATGKGSVRAINAIPTSPSIAFLIEERSITTVDYKRASAPQQYDDLEYKFNFEVTFPDTGRQRLASQFVDIVADKDYTFVISGALSNPAITLWEGDQRTFGETDNLFEARFGHTAAALGDVDVYFAEPGVAPVLGQQVATLAFGEVSPVADYASGNYVLIYTEAGDPAAVLFTSDSLAPTLRTAFTINLFAGDANELGPVAVRLFDAAGGTLAITDVNLSPTVRFFHASMGLATADIYDKDPAVEPPLVTDHAFGAVTADLPITAGANTLTYTTAGDTGVVLFEEERTFLSGTRNNYYVVGETGALLAVASIPDRRPVETIIKLSLMQAAANHELIDFYLVEADADIADAAPLFFSVPVGTAPLGVNLLAGSFDLYLTTPNEKTIVAGPLRLDATLGDVVDVIALDTVDPATADLVFVPQP